MDAMLASLVVGSGDEVGLTDGMWW
jgi:hypothetical protein